MPKKYDREPIAWITRGGKHVPIFDKITDVTPKGFGPSKGGKRVTPVLEKLKGETTDQAIERIVGYQIDNGKTINDLKHIKSPNLYEFMKTVPKFRLVISVDTITPHICVATDTNAIVLWGGASSPFLTGYSHLRNIITPSKCRCWVSVKQEEYKNPNCPKGCIDAIEVGTVYKAAMEELCSEKRREAGIYK